MEANFFFLDGTIGLDFRNGECIGASRFWGGNVEEMVEDFVCPCLISFGTLEVMMPLGFRNW